MQSQQLVAAQKQQLKLSPQMYQSLELMALPLLDLKEKIQIEIEKNPALALSSERDISFERIERAEGGGSVDLFENSSDPGYIRKSNDINANSKQQFLEGALARSESLQAHLEEQLHVLNLNPEEMEVGELVISNLDSHGFYREPPEALIREDQLEVLTKVIKIIQGFEPPGICVPNYVESLILQTELDELSPEFTAEIIRHHLNDLRRGKLDLIAKELTITIEEVEDIFAYIKQLNPYPGSAFSMEATQYVIPDIMIRKKNRKLVMQLNADQIPILQIDPDFEQLAAEQEGRNDSETDKFIQHSLRDARNLITTIEMRNSSLRKVGAVLLKRQMDFFLNGPKYLRPLTLKDVAEEISVHETTVSRISNAKYIQTDWGIFPIKYFFTNAVTGKSDDGKSISKTGVKEVIREIIEEYTGKKRLSDQKISDMLAERNITVARRTVAKYRKELNIDSSFDR